MPKIIVPAAGFGRRVGSPESKEMIIFQGKPLIQWVFELALSRQWPVHIVSRQEKKSLQKFSEDWADGNGLKLQIQNVGVTSEWMDSVLLSQEFWQEKNLLILPDTRFLPLQAIDQVADELGKFDLCFATHSVEDPKLWGVVQRHEEQLWVAEKPMALMKEKESHKAWGAIGFRPLAGKELFAKMKQSGWQQVSASFSFLNLTWFEDLTRDGKAIL